MTCQLHRIVRGARTHTHTPYLHWNMYLVRMSLCEKPPPDGSNLHSPQFYLSWVSLRTVILSFLRDKAHKGESMLFFVYGANPLSVFFALLPVVPLGMRCSLPSSSSRQSIRGTPRSSAGLGAAKAGLGIWDGQPGANDQAPERASPK